ncbi:MAG: DUF5676 family membrane protein [Acidovorax sp.]|jgi:hypothetical protein|uniref:DUF5676 family membrane protein n=1 Tax=unclassified Acidovorax TaxID=2684926 RepID=UPI00023FD177|nr:DUF5676 family membrane protein [Acidovorax sp. NO-1]EHL22400.1 hypothetical protein KYG_13291 [Acidovorax sp. NO-1]MDP3230280.1 DUF5676 family membrane protein [Acidovorax sp.]
MRPLRTGVALAATVGGFYVLCTVAWILVPATFLDLMNNLFHGMDFTAMVSPRPFSVFGFFKALLVLSTWALLAGMFFSWLHNRLER